MWTPELLVQISKKTASILKRKLTDDENRSIISLSRTINPSMYKNTTINRMIENMADIAATNIKFDTVKYISNEIKDNKERENVYDIHINEIDGINNTEELLREINPVALHEKNYIVLDTFNRDTTLNDGKRFRWNFSNTTETGTGTVNMTGRANKLIGMKLYNFILPANSLIVYAHRVSMLISEFSADSFHVNGFRYHFIIKPEVLYGVSGTPAGYEARTDEGCDGAYTFGTPISYIDTLTLSFTDTASDITFNKDRLNATFTYGATTALIFSENINVATSTTRILIKSFTTDAPDTDRSIIDAINNKNGIIATVFSTTQLRFTINTTTITPTSGLSCEVFFFDKRMVFFFELTFTK